MSREIALTRGLAALVDDADFEWLSATKWSASIIRKGHPSPYARGVWKPTGRVELMHRLITGAAPGEIVDHINRNTLDNRKSNLRFCSAAQNAWNAARQPGKAGFRGVVFRFPKSYRRGVWVAQLRVHGRSINKWSFDDPESAARAYDALALEHHGEFAVLNFPPHRTAA